MTSFKVNDDSLWTEFIEKGVLKGFSIEGNFSKKEVALEIHTEYDEEEYNDIHSLYVKMAYTAADLDSYYIWKVSGKDNNCPICIGYDKQVKKLSVWITTAIPRVKTGTLIAAGLSTSYKHGDYGTYCEQHCSCTLKKASKSFRKKYIKKPF